MRETRHGAHGGQQESDRGEQGIHSADPLRPRSRIPQEGVWFDDELAPIFGVTPQSLREFIYRSRIPYIPAFRQIMVNMEDFFRHGLVMPGAEPPPEEPPPPPPKKPKKGSA